MSTTRVGVDVGGTFTDVILHDANGRATVRKLLSTPPAYDVAVVEAVGELATGATAPPAEVVHGTTVATNAVLQRLGSRTALVTTKGFRDVLELRRLRVPHMYDLFWRKPEPIVERRLRFEVDERVTADGTVLRPLDEDEARALAARLRASGVESVAVCLLHSYVHPAHEEALGRILAEELPGVAISLSSEILREQREYERTATTVVNAYVRPLMSSYIDRIRTGLDGRGLTAPVSIMQSSGGVMTAADARTRPVFALESGPAAGVVAAVGIARRLGIHDAIAFDMGGTTAKASLIERGAIARGREYEVGGSLSAGSRLIRGSGELLRIPTIDIAEVGAGGGSLAWLDAGGGLQVGPRSAGADPGPACYGRGGVEPTVTDANLVLGLLPEGSVADGQITLSRPLAVEALEQVATPLGLELLEAAAGIHRIANARMTRALRSVSSEKGRDPRDFAIVAYGGSGPVHAAGLADDLGVRTVVVPAVAGLFSAVGLLFARSEFHDVRTCHLDVDTVAPEHVEALLAEMRRELEAAFPGTPAEWSATAELRYGGQSWEVEVALPEPGPARDDQLQAAPGPLDAPKDACDDQLQGAIGPGAEPEGADGASSKALPGVGVARDDQSQAIPGRLAAQGGTDACDDQLQGAIGLGVLPEGAGGGSPQALPDLGALRARFEDEHERLYGVRGQPGSPVEIRAVRLAALGPVPATGGLAVAAHEPAEATGGRAVTATDGLAVAAHEPAEATGGRAVTTTGGLAVAAHEPAEATGGRAVTTTDGLAAAADGPGVEADDQGHAAVTRAVAFDGELVETTVCARSAIGVEPTPGPLLVDEYDTTVVVPPGWSVRRDEATASLILERRA